MIEPETDDLPATKEPAPRLRSPRKLAALHSRREPSVPAQLVLDGLDRHFLDCALDMGSVSTMLTTVPA
jgi:hypothetical protein